MLSYFPRGVLDEILNLIESVSDGFPSYSCNYPSSLGILYHIGIELYVMYKSQKLRSVSASTQANTNFCFSQELKMVYIW